MKLPLNAIRQTKLRQIDASLSEWRKLARRNPPRGGWLKTLRTALGMSARQAATRLHAAHPRAIELEKAEADGTATLNSMRKAAEALGCDFVYAIVPRDSLKQIIENRAREKAKALVGDVVHTMALEDQAPDNESREALIESRATALLQGSLSRLWEDGKSK